MHILFVSAEVAPFASTGGLGQVCGALPKALCGRGHRVTVVTPLYRETQLQGAQDTGESFWFWLFGERHQARYFHVCVHEHLDIVLVENPMFDRDGLYEDHFGPFGDNIRRFALLSRAALEAPRLLQGRLWDVHEPDVIHAHDWSGALSLVYAEALYKPLGLMANTRLVHTVHNAAHQGLFAHHVWDGLDLPARFQGLFAHPSGVNSTLCAGIRVADVVTLVSPTFAAEVRTKMGGFGLHEVFEEAHRKGSLHGVLNGMDRVDRDPTQDPSIPYPFTAQQLDRRACNRRAVQDHLGLAPRDDLPILALIARFDWQKGLDLILDVMPDLLRLDAQWVFMGSGDSALEEAFQTIAHNHPQHAATWIGYNDALARLLYAGSDFNLVPSRFEPCGLSQLYAMRYGCVPIVRNTGGLRDTVQPFHAEASCGWGWVFEDATPQAFLHCVRDAVKLWHLRPDAFACAQTNAMLQDFGWARSARTYERLYTPSLFSRS